MTVSLSKGDNVSLSKEVPDLSAIDVGLGWDARVTTGAAFDLDASAFLLHESGKVRSDADFIFYNNKASANNAVVHQGDNTSGAGEGDDEIISITLAQVPADVQKVAFSVTIHEAETRKQTFGQVSNAYVRVVNKANGKEITRYDLSEDYSIETAMIFGELYRHSGQWKFKAIGQGFAGGLGPLAQNFGVNIG
ncbi:Tellurium resistance protein TerD [invertebrate metagenome]|uniref:Tellurium resistance protein TerD n=1 Tax=invertebrate metagenome TaxID=1711999 RepID=A0A484H6N4_9ZZZZ